MPKPTELTTIEPALPLLAASTVPDLLRGFTVWEEGRQVIASRLPTTEEASAMRKRLAMLDAHLRPFSAAVPDKESIQRGLAAWFLGYPSMQNADAKGLVAAYMLDLKMLPAFAILRALEDIKKGAVTETDARGRTTVIGQDWPPASPRVYAQAVKIMQGHVEEQIKIRQLLKAKPAQDDVPEEDRAEIAIRIRKMADDAKRRMGKPDAATIAFQEESERRRRIEEERSRAAFEEGAREEYAQLGVEPRYVGGIMISPELAAKLEPQTFAGKGK